LHLDLPSPVASGERRVGTSPTRRIECIARQAVLLPWDKSLRNSTPAAARLKPAFPYNNTYCMVYKVIEGRIQEITEYLDTELVTAAFGI
jgi:hypothetical protein